MSKSKSSSQTEEVVDSAAEEVAEVAEGGEVFGIKFPAWLRKATKGKLTDPYGSAVFSNVNATKVDVAPKPGSWLWCQLEAKTITE